MTQPSDWLIAHLEYLRLTRDFEGALDRVIVQKPRQHSRTFGLGDSYNDIDDDQEGGAS